MRPRSEETDKDGSLLRALVLALESLPPVVCEVCGGTILSPSQSGAPGGVAIARRT